MVRMCLLLVAAFVGLALGEPWIGEPRNEGWWIDRHNSYVQNTFDNKAGINVLFYGDSITEGWGGAGAAIYNQFYAPLGTANYGIGGDQTQHVLWRINNGEVDGLNPKLCVLKIGTNNLGGNSDADIAQGVVTIVGTLRQALPNMKILLLGVLPRNNADLTQRTDNINDIIMNMDNGNNIRFFNMRDFFYRGNGMFNTELYDQDLLHLSTAGYAKWQEVMDPIFQQMLN